MKRQQLIDFINNLKKSRADAYAAGDWDLVDLIQLCIDDAKKDLASL